MHNLDETLQSFLRWFWICLGTSALFGALAFILIRRRDLWLRYMDAEEAFWQRFGLPKGGWTRRFAESRFLAMSFVFFAVLQLLLAAACIAFYFHYRRRV
jgi:hypothetical protein